MRASDQDRQRVVDELQRHTAAGRLSLDEFSDRVSVVYTARTLGELSVLTHDLPADPPPEPGSGPATGTAHQLLLVFMIAAITLALLLLYMALTR